MAWIYYSFIQIKCREYIYIYIYIYWYQCREYCIIFFFLIKKKNPWVPHFYLFDFFKQYIISYLSFLLLSVYIIYRFLFHHNIIRISINIYISNVSNYQSSYYFFLGVNESSYYLVISNWCFVLLHCMVLWISTRA